MQKTVITVGIGETGNGGKLNAYEQGIIRSVITDEAARVFGGATITDGFGVWVDNGRTISEPVLVLTLYHDLPDWQIAGFAAFCGGAARQKAVVVETSTVSVDFQEMLIK